MRSSSLFLAVKHHIPSPREYRDTLIHEWYIPQKYKDYLQAFFQRKCSASDLLAIVRDGEITIDGQHYAITWVNSPTKIKENGMAILSFRRCRFLGAGYVLAKCLFDGEKLANLQELVINPETTIQDKPSFIKRFIGGMK